MIYIDSVKIIDKDVDINNRDRLHRILQYCSMVII